MARSSGEFDMTVTSSTASRQSQVPLHLHSQAALYAIRMTLGTRIKQARTAKKWSLQKLADEMGITKQLVWQWERDDTDPRKHIEELSRLLDVPVEYFYGDKRAPGVLATKIGQLGTDQQAMIEAMVDALLRQQDQDHPRVKRS